MNQINQIDLPREIDASHNGVYFTGAKFIRRQYGGQTKWMSTIPTSPRPALLTLRERRLIQLGKERPQDHKSSESCRDTGAECHRYHWDIAQG